MHSHRQGTSLLHLDASASGRDDSVTRRLTARYADIWRGLHGPAGYRYRDLAAQPVPLVSPAFVSLGIRVERHGTVPLPKVAELAEGPAEEHEWALTLPLITELRAAGTVLMGVPMYNFSVPASLKAWIDRVTFPGAFLDDGTGDRLLRRTKVVVVTARGGCYAPGTPREDFDFQTPYLRAYFTDLGVAPGNLHFVHAEMTRAADVPALARFTPLAADSLAAARTAVSDLAGEPAGRTPR
ncbi:FMN-dependent NADH-azoreductase [Microbispora sp. H13382]|uniref:FMN-dependent NADH-azoreductase n=1 Tax=Microbispora sp. H13382 TaxID=2729112 RepID=UPI00160208F5|nr:NAD(P)H-dependent oxidoreductase [Microbispora sp. H13382]